MAWLGLLFLLLTTMMVLSALGAQRNFRRAAGAPPPDPADVFKNWPRRTDIAPDRSPRLAHPRLMTGTAPSLSGRSFSGAF